ncbi:DHPS [Cordylochernes scorpioides]|uniref:DHPS n=1 Tax=Cordylochernes scorpioides TaxID=51811 RepID=A0ABY6K6V7_9ARAC|nr:DHPS [Cordylochernes scorpioides]
MDQNVQKAEIPQNLVDAVLIKTTAKTENSIEVKGYDLNEGVDYNKLLNSYLTTGFQATNYGLAVQQVKNMLESRQVPVPQDKADDHETDPFIKRRTGCTIFLGYTSNLVSSGVRETIRFLVQHRMVDCLVTTAGGVEEDLIKCLAPTLLGDFSLKGSELRVRNMYYLRERQLVYGVRRKQGLNRIGNLLVPNDNYCKFEEWLLPVLDKMLEEQKSQGTVWSPSKLITRLGEEINNEDSICYWAAKTEILKCDVCMCQNQIPIFCPALTDGSLGDMIYFHSYRNPGLIVDIAQDIRRINTMAVKAIKSGMIILGGGVIKHHICNANLMRNGADYSVFINTANEFDGSDSGARPDEAVSWGKIRMDASPVKVYAEATLVFPLLVAQTFATCLPSQ